MPDNPTLTIPFAEPSVEGEAHWIRLEQVELPDEASTLAQAADLVDALFGVEPCDLGLGNGGEPFDEEELPEEADYLETARGRLPLTDCDEDDLWWDAEMDVLRSHQDDAYTLESATVRVMETRIEGKNVSETVEMDGASYDLAWPYAGGIAVSGADAEVADVRGSTLNFAAPVKGRVRIRYRAQWDRVKLRVRKGGAATTGDRTRDLIAAVYAVGGGSRRSRLDDAAVVTAFWRDLAASCDVTRPPEDDQTDAAELDRLCNPKRTYHLDGDCWQTIEKYNICNCSGREAPNPPEPEIVPAPCPEGQAPGTSVGVVRELGEYVDCEGEDKEGLNDPEFFKEHCCEASPRANLPRCRETREPHKGGAEIENGPDYYKNIYGESVRLVAVTPEGGRCGDLIKVWAVPDVVEPPPVLPERLPVSKNQTFTVTVLSGGRQPFTWQPPAGVRLLGTAAYGFMGIFQADNTFRQGRLTVIDACGREAECLLGACRWATVGRMGKHTLTLLAPSDIPADFPLASFRRDDRRGLYYATQTQDGIYILDTPCQGWLLAISEDASIIATFFIYLSSDDRGYNWWYYPDFMLDLGSCEKGITKLIEYEYSSTSAVTLKCHGYQSPHPVSFSFDSFDYATGYYKLTLKCRMSSSKIRERTQYGCFHLDYVYARVCD